MGESALENEAIHKIKIDDILENCDLVGIKFNDSYEVLEKNFGKTFADFIYDEQTKYAREIDKDTAEQFLASIVNMDGFYQKLFNEQDGLIDETKKLNFQLTFRSDDGKEQKLNFKNFQLGIGDSTKGIEHLLMQSDDIANIKSRSRLDRICSIPSEVTLSKIGSMGHNLTDSLKKSIPQSLSPEAAAFLHNFIDSVLDKGAEEKRREILKFDRQQELDKKLKEKQKNNSEIVETIDNNGLIILDKKLKDFKNDREKFKEYSSTYNKANENFATKKIDENTKNEILKNLQNKFDISENEYKIVLKHIGQIQKMTAEKKNNMNMSNKNKSLAKTPILSKNATSLGLNR